MMEYISIVLMLGFILTGIIYTIWSSLGKDRNMVEKVGLGDHYD